MSSLRGIRIQRKPASIEPKPLLQSPSSSASDEEETWNKGFSTNYQKTTTDKATPAKSKSMGPKSKTMGPKSKTGPGNEDDIQLALALSMDPKQQANIEHEQYLTAIEKSKQDSTIKSSATKNEKQSKPTAVNKTKKETDKSNRPFAARNGNSSEWMDDEVSSEDESPPVKVSNNTKKTSKNGKQNSQKNSGQANKKRDRSSSAASDSESVSDVDKKSKKAPNKVVQSSSVDDYIVKLNTNTTKNGPNRSQRNTKPKQSSRKSKYKEDSTSDEDGNSDSDEEPKKVSNFEPVSKEFQPAPKRTFSKRKPSGDASDVSEDGEYIPSDSESKRPTRSAKTRAESPPEVITEVKHNRPVRGGKPKVNKPSYGKHPIPNEQILEYVSLERTLLYITCIAKQIVDSQRMRLFVDVYQNKNLEIEDSHPLRGVAPLDFYKDDGEIDKKLEGLLEKPLEAGKAVLTEDGKHAFDDDCKQKFLKFVLIPECIIHLLKKQFSMGDQDAEEFYQQSGSRG